MHFESSLASALRALRDSDYAIEGAGAIDESFLTQPEVVHELWRKLLDPTEEEEVNVGRLFERLDDVWQGQQGFTDERKQQQHEAIEYLVDVLGNELWCVPELRSSLESKILRQLDTRIPLAKRRSIIKTYITQASKFMKEEQRKLVGGGEYVEPIVQRFRREPDSEECFRRIPGTGQELGYQQEAERYQEVDVDEFFTSGVERLIAVIADSGYGKTSLLQELFIRACRRWRDKEPLPVFISPEDAACCTEEALRIKVFERLSAALPRTDGRPPVRPNQLQTLASDLKDGGELLLFFDALDQISDPQPAVSCISSMSIGKSHIVFTARPAAWQAHRSKLGGFTYCRLLEFDAGRVMEYFGELKDLPTLRELSPDLLAIPILARMLRDILTENKTALAGVLSRSDLYHKFLHYLPNREQDQLTLKACKRTADDVYLAMRDLAVKTLRWNRLGQFTRSDASKAIGAEELYILERLQFVLRFIETGDELVFRHRSFQEFLAADALLEEFQAPSDIDRIRKYLVHPNWEESVKFLAGMLDSPRLEALLAALLDPEGRPVLVLYHDDIRLACLCLHEAKVTAPRVASRVLSRIADVAHTDRRKAFELLVAWGKREATDHLVRDLAGRNTAMRAGAAWALGKTSSEATVGPLVAALKDPDGSVRWAAAWALGNIRSEATIRYLSAVLYDLHEPARSAAAEALASVGSDTAIVFLITAVRDDTPDVRLTASDALANIRVDGEVYRFTAALRGGDVNTRCAAARILGGLGSEARVQRLIAALEDESKVVSRAAARALRNLGFEDVVEQLIVALHNRHKSVRRSAEEALSHIYATGPAEDLVVAFRAADAAEDPSDLRDAPSLDGEDDAPRTYTRVLAYGEEDMSPYDADSLREGTDVQFLIGALRHRSESIRSAAAEGLVRIGSSEVLALAVKSYHDESLRMVKRELLAVIAEVDRAIRAARLIE